MSKIESQVQNFEGLRLRAYDDATGLTLKKGVAIVGSVAIGYGRDLLTKGITKAEADMLRAADLGEAEGTFADMELSWFANLNEVRQDVVVLMVYQMGAKGFRKFKGVIDAIKARDFDGAAKEMLKSTWAHQTPERVRRMAEMMRTGRYSG